MSKVNFSDEFRRDAVAQITERGYPVAEVSQRLGVSQHSLYAWKKKFSRPAGGDDKDAEIRRLKRDLVRVTEERDIKKSHRVFRQRCQVRYATPARRPTYSLLDCSATRALIGDAPVPWRDNLHQMLTEEAKLG